MAIHIDPQGRIRDELNRFARNPFQDEPEQDIGGIDIPPRLYDSISEVMRGYIRLIRGVLLNSDIAYRTDRRHQRMMRNDPDVMAPLLQREMSVALLEWNIVAEDEDDETQLDQAKQVQKLIVHHTPRLTDMLLRLADAVWYGPAAVNIIYQKVQGGMIAPTAWLPFQSDTLIFTEKGQLGMKVGVRYPGPKFPSWDGNAHLFEDDERRAIVLHTFQQQGPEYDEFEEGRFAFAGRGLRDTVYFTWRMKQLALQMWMKFIERYGMGIRVLRYPGGNPKAQANMEEIGRNMLQDVTVLIPSDETDSGKPQYDINILDPANGGGGTKIFADMIDGYLAGQIKELIIGQTATTESTTQGLGTGVSDQHAHTYNRIVKFDALSLADGLTREFVWEIHRMNFGDTPYRPRWVFALEDVDSEEFMKGVEAFVRVGGVVSQRQVREQLGLKEPSDDEDTLGGDELGMMGLGAAGALGGSNLETVRGGIRSALTDGNGNGQVSSVAGRR